MAPLYHIHEKLHPTFIQFWLGNFNPAFFSNTRRIVLKKIQVLFLSIILSLFFFNELRAQILDKSKPYWEYVRTESGVFPYAVNGCYQPTVHKSQEGWVEITVTKCLHPDDKKPVHTRLKFEWTTPQRIIYVGEPIDYKLTTTLIENSDPEWLLKGSIWMRPEIGKDDSFNGPFPGWAGGSEAALGKGSPNPVILDNLKRTDPDKAIAGWNQSDYLRLNFVAYHSNQHWWSYIYRYVVPTQKDIEENPIMINGIWKVVEKDAKDG